ncbi:class I SAM-dependent DNA methyltransferase [Priestia aryabhattai]|uniref:class I SAM-dependent DNA methyltransferase n=1 Tax=Priestia aryabhattai TaxID=412384 RepID=UPI001CBB5F93|nr:N-6 DNA methylase [Priestia aryabhattai]
MLQTNVTLKNKVDQLWNKFWSGGISNPLTAVEQITYLLFMKQLDYLDFKQMSDAKKAGIMYTSMFDGTYRIPSTDQIVDKQTLRWSYFSKMSPEEMLSHVQVKVFPFLKDLRGYDLTFAKYIKNAVFVIPKPALLVEAVFTIEEIFSEIEKYYEEQEKVSQEIQGDVYEMLLSQITKGGVNGQFKTPKHIIKLIVELIEPYLGSRIIDPACGTGGFLLESYKYIEKQLLKDRKVNKTVEDKVLCNALNDEISNTLNNNLYGYDIDMTMVRLAAMNLMMHGIDNSHVYHKNTLSEGSSKLNQYDIVMTNPPFKGFIEGELINKSLTLRTKKSELLFLENVYNLLKIGGTAGVIIPDGVLFGKSKATVEARKILIENCELKAVIKLPNGVFKPYTSVSTAILIFTKGSETKDVWFYDMHSDGYSLDDTRETLINYGDLPELLKEYRIRNPYDNHNRKKKFFFVSKDEIVGENYDLSIDRYKEYALEEVTYEKPSIILSRLKEIEEDIHKELAELEEML